MSVDLPMHGNKLDTKTKMALFMPKKPNGGCQTDWSPTHYWEQRIEDEGKPMSANKLASASNIANFDDATAIKEDYLASKERGGARARYPSIEVFLVKNSLPMGRWLRVLGL